jgi:hypothetical protein
MGQEGHSFHKTASGLQRLLKTLYNILNPDENYLQNVLRRRAKNNPRLAAIIENLESSTMSSGGNSF